MAKDGFLEARDRKYLKDMERETLEELDRREDPAAKPMLCKCGHTLAQHYPGTQAMPCGKCACSWCTAPRAEDVRRKRARLGVKDITPHPDFRKRR
jgi:hypothetical protein